MTTHEALQLMNDEGASLQPDDRWPVGQALTVIACVTIASRIAIAGVVWAMVR
jgi:hypothetical protein